MVWKQVGKLFVSLINKSPLLVYLAFLLGWCYILYQYSEPELASGWAAASAIVGVAFLLSLAYYIRERSPQPTLAIDVRIEGAEIDVNANTDE